MRCMERWIPRDLANADIAVRRYGDLGHRWLDGMWQADPLADAVVADDFGALSATDAVRAALEGGIDSVTDAPMLREVGHAFAVNPDRTLRRLAAELGWGVLTFARPVALRSRLDPTTPALAAVGVTALALAGWVAWRVWRRRVTS